jgi:hypothetical protein
VSGGAPLPRVAFASLGGKVNQYDTALLQTARRARCEIVPIADGNGLAAG